MDRAVPLIALVVLAAVVSPAPLATGADSHVDAAPEGDPAAGIDAAPGGPSARKERGDVEGRAAPGASPPTATAVPVPTAVPSGARWDDGDGADGADPAPTPTDRGPATTGDEGTIEVVFELDPEAPVPRPIRPAVERVSVEEGERLAYASTSLAVVDSLAEHPDVRSTRLQRGAGRPDVANRSRSAAGRIGGDLVHRANVTGRDVTVGVIDAGFRIAHPALAANVGAYRQFDDGGDWRHGTAVAAVVADVAPDATVDAAAVGPRVTPEEYEAAVEWLLDSGADVIVDAGSYHGQPGNGTGPIARTATRAAERAVVVTSVGNHAGSYWRGNHTGEAGDWVSFDGREGNPLDGSGGAVRATLRWGDPAANFGLYLLRDQPGRDALVDSTVASGADRHVALGITVPAGDYYLAVRNAGRNTGAGSGPANATGAAGTTLELVTERELRHSSRPRPSAPATAPDVLAVGAVHNGTLRPFSVPGADLVAPDRIDADGLESVTGTSIAAPYVAGAAALTVAGNPDLPAAQVRGRLLAGAADAGPVGPDPRTGHGLVDAGVAVHPPAVWPVRPGGNVTVGHTETVG